MSGLVSDRAIEHEGEIIGYVERLREGDFHAWNEMHAIVASSYEAAVAWLMEQHAKEQA